MCHEGNAMTVKYFKCDAPFGAETAPWCNCDQPLRTLRCATCGSCFCAAPMPYKRRFWDDAPQELRENPNRFFARFGAPATHIERRPSNIRPLVLIVDDDEAMRSLVACYVEQLGYNAISIGDPEEALSHASFYRFDVLITDALMPRLDGRELCRRLKALPENATKKVILMSSLYKSARARLEAYQFGIDEFLPKPIAFNELATILGRIAPIERQLATIRTAV
jgi:CheY-like chemotaxis protein